MNITAEYYPKDFVEELKIVEAKMDFIEGRLEMMRDKLDKAMKGIITISKSDYEKMKEEYYKYSIMFPHLKARGDILLTQQAS